VDNIIALVNAALLEKQLVVFCPHIGTLGSVVLALVPLLRPFTWQSLVMPVTPVNMLGFLDAPVPFVLGVQYKTPDVASRWGLLPAVWPAVQLQFGTKVLADHACFTGL
jgi:hypothetical protein